MENNILDCVIIGSGPSGFTAAIYAARADLKPELYTGYWDYGSGQFPRVSRGSYRAENDGRFTETSRKI